MSNSRSPWWITEWFLDCINADDEYGCSLVDHCTNMIVAGHYNYQRKMWGYDADR